VNVPEYRQAMIRAQQDFSSAVSAAAEVLSEELHRIDNQFFEEQDRAGAVIAYGGNEGFSGGNSGTGNHLEKKGH
jgi:hypothetical protein